ncbi:unnamed protein product [Urochloa decumbens]|uniref:Glycosyltransferase N-terminal domain-containing protein n=1 Tax=Urochloa decumbens TaxID=240449 RepID=A0ABC9BHP1_9POAL
MASAAGRPLADNNGAHFVLVPLMAQGHAIPMADMARLLADHGAQVSFVTTPANASRMSAFVAHAEATGLAIRLVTLRFPAVDFGLPDGCESADMLGSKDLYGNFLDACAALRDPLAAFLREEQRRPPAPSCIVSDAMHWWTAGVARELGIPRLSFNGNCGFASLVRYIIIHGDLLEHVADEDELVRFPGFPTPLELAKAKCPGSMYAPGLKEIRKKIYEEIRCAGVAMNSFHDLEPVHIESFRRITGKKVWTVGPMCLCNQESSAMAARGNKASVDEARCLRWLDSMKEGSVIFVSFGSLACTEPQQLVELGLGLEASGKPFVWVIKAGDRLPQVEEWLAEGFEERVKDRGMIIRGWAPQLVILWHQAVGGFMTHCGWNSTIECICAGVPMITWPHFGEQFVNERLVVDVLKTGVEVGVGGVTQWATEQKEVKVGRNAVRAALSKLMDEGIVAEEMRMRAKELGIKAREALAVGGSSHNNVNLLIQEMGNKANATD